MVWMKFIGAAFFVLSITYFGYAASKYETLKLKETEAFINLIRHIKSEIACYRTPLPEIIASYSNKELENCGFLSCAGESWNTALRKASDKLHIDAKTNELLEKFGNELGTSYKDEQMICCDYYLEKLESHAAILGAKLPQTRKMLRLCAFLLGILIVIILI